MPSNTAVLLAMTPYMSPSGSMFELLTTACVPVPLMSAALPGFIASEKLLLAKLTAAPPSPVSKLLPVPFGVGIAVTAVVNICNAGRYACTQACRRYARVVDGGTGREREVIRDGDAVGRESVVFDPRKAAVGGDGRAVGDRVEDADGGDAVYLGIAAPEDFSIAVGRVEYGGPLLTVNAGRRALGFVQREVALVAGGTVVGQPDVGVVLRWAVDDRPVIVGARFGLGADVAGAGQVIQVEIVVESGSVVGNVGVGPTRWTLRQAGWPRRL